MCPLTAEKGDHVAVLPDMGEECAQLPAADASASDALLIERSRDEADAFTGIYDRYLLVIHRYVAGRVGSQVADDLAAEAFLVAFRGRARFDPARGAVRPWLFGIATNLIARHRRAEARHYRTVALAGAESVTASDEGTQVLEMAAAEGLQPRLARALAALPRHERDVVLLVALGDLSHGEIAQALGVSYGTVGSRLSRARAKLRTALHQEVLADE